MIQAEHAIAIDARIDTVWDYVQDIRRWANLFPGCQDCEVINEHESRWTIKVGAGGLVKTVKVLVTVAAWDGPERVNFTYRLETDPVEGRGSYTATATDAGATTVHLALEVAGTGSMAPMWEAMSKPLLPQLAKTFSGRLKAEIESGTLEAVPGESPDLVPDGSRGGASYRLEAIGHWLGRLWRRLFRRG